LRSTEAAIDRERQQRVLFIGTMKTAATSTTKQHDPRSEHPPLYCCRRA
jgi:hypothetical protein